MAEEQEKQQQNENEQTPNEENQQNMDTTENGNNENNSNSGGTGDEDDRKLFVGGLPQDAKENDIKEHFATFGEIESINLKTDPATGRSRGFAFVVFKSVESLDKAVNSEHNIKAKKVAVKKAQAKQGKIYVGKLKTDLSDEDIKNHFAQYGPIANIEQPYDKIKNERKNFCFVTFEKEEPAKKLLKEGNVTINGIELEIKKVTPKPDVRAMGGPMGGFGGGRGGGAGGRGGGAPWGGSWGGYGGYGDYWSGGYGGYGADPYYGGWGGYGGGWGGYGSNGNATAGGGGFAGGKTPRGGPRGAGQARGGGRGGGMGTRGAQRQKPY